MSQEIAQSLFGAANVLCRAQRELECALDAIFGPEGQGWQDYEYDRASRGLEVFGAEQSELAVAKLRTLGFANVVVHDHEESRFVDCDCRARGNPQ